jgi:AMME syndrome candidate gene 1 protein
MNKARDPLSNRTKRLRVCSAEIFVKIGWDREETIDSLIRKAGHKGQITLDIRKTIRLVRYRSEKLSLAFTEYAQVRRLKV